MAVLNLRPRLTTHFAVLHISVLVFCWQASGGCLKFLLLDGRDKRLSQQTRGAEVKEKPWDVETCRILILYLGELAYPSH